MKTKIISFVLIVLLCTVLISSCTNIDNSTSTSNLSRNQVPYSSISGMPPNAKQIGGEMGGIEFFATSEDGFYELIGVFPGSTSIFYTDYATNKKMYLCSRPECNHDSDSCLSYIDVSKGNIPGVLYADGKLLLISPATSSGSYNPNIEIMNPDGSDRHELISFKATQDIGMGWYLLCDKTIYFMMSDVSDSGGYSLSLVSVVLDTGEFCKIADYESNTWLYDWSDSKIYLKLVTDHAPTNSEGFTVYGTEMSHEIVRIDLQNPNEYELIEQWENDDMYTTMLNGCFYAYNPLTKTFIMKSFADGLIKEVDVSEFEVHYPTFNEIIDNILIVGAITGNPTDPSPERAYIAVDFDSSKAWEIPLLNNWNKPIQICGEYQDKLFVQYGIEESIKIGELDGEVVEFNVIEMKMGYITKTDFFAGIPNYISTEYAY